LAINKLLHAANCNPKSVGPYTNKLDILIVGDGDLSFSRALAYSIGGSRLTATCYDSLNAFKSKYRSSLANISELKQLEVQTHFGVDATRLEEQKWLNDPTKATAERKQFHRIVFNFPHAGQDDEESRPSTANVHRSKKTKKPKHGGDDGDKKKRKRGVGGGNIPQHDVVKRYVICSGTCCVSCHGVCRVVVRVLKRMWHSFRRERAQEPEAALRVLRVGCAVAAAGRLGPDPCGPPHIDTLQAVGHRRARTQGRPRT
jgi:hypothetical protein